MHTYIHTYIYIFSLLSRSESRLVAHLSHPHVVRKAAGDTDKDAQREMFTYIYIYIFIYLYVSAIAPQRESTGGSYFASARGAQGG